MPKKMRPSHIWLAVVASLTVGQSTLASTSQDATALLSSFGEIAALGEGFYPLCPCGIGIELIDESGRVLGLSIGPSRKHPYGGLRIGSIDPSSETAALLASGSEDERALVAKLWRFLDTHYSLGEQQQLFHTANADNPQPTDAGAVAILRILDYWNASNKIKRWLDNNVSQRDQDRIFATRYSELETNREREVFQQICLMLHRSLEFPAVSNEKRGEVVPVRCE